MQRRELVLYFACACTYVCMYGYMYVCMYECMYVRMYECMYVRMYVCMYVYMYVCMNVRGVPKVSLPFLSFSKSVGLLPSDPIRTCQHRQYTARTLEPREVLLEPGSMLEPGKYVGTGGSAMGILGILESMLERGRYVGTQGSMEPMDSGKYGGALLHCGYGAAHFFERLEPATRSTEPSDGAWPTKKMQA